MSEWKSIDHTEAWPGLSAMKPEDLRTALTPARIAERQVGAGGGLTYCWASMDVGDTAVAALQAAVRELGLVEQYKAIASGRVMNVGERRMVLHHLTRGEPAGQVVKDDRDFRKFYEAERGRFSLFAEKVRSGALRGSTGKPFERVVQIGIGGSDLGPRALYLALEQWARERGLLKLKASFISNVDPDDANAVISGLDPERSLFILVSKSGTTQETLANEALVKASLGRVEGIDPSRHIVAVTSETSPLARNPGYLDSFYIDDFIGGRYSSTSAVGGVALSLALGPEAFAAILEGASEADRLALNERLVDNPSMLDAMLGVFQRCVLARPTVAVLPYSQALSRFPAHLQQLDMESNGKRVDRYGAPLSLRSGPVVMGEPGTNGQHSFYQLLHQGTDVVPLQFIGFRKNQTSFDPEFEGSTARRKLNANLAAQIVAFALGKDDQDPNKAFPGGRPSSLLVGDELDPKALGALLAHFENKVMFQGLSWNLNSFDQEGVQLGKKLTGAVLALGAPSSGANGAQEKESQRADTPLSSYARLLGAL